MNDQTIANIIPKIHEQADTLGGWMHWPLLELDGSKYTGPGESEIRVARNPFTLWALGNFEFERHGRQRPQWTVISPDGVRSLVDSGLHTDWVLSAGLVNGEEYGLVQTPWVHRHACIARAIDREQAKLIREWSGASFVTLARGDQRTIYGKVVHPRPTEPVPPGSIAIIPQASPAYQAAMLSACSEGQWGQRGAIICEQGGPLAHLATVGRESRCTVLRLDDALSRFRPGAYVEIDLTAGTLCLNA